MGIAICPDSISSKGGHVTQLQLRIYNWKSLGRLPRKLLNGTDF
jgi:hypothetical protein